MLNKTIFAAAVFTLALPIAAGYAQDTMASDAMADDSMASDAMMSDDDLALCIEQAQAISFAEVAATAEHACHTVHNGGQMGSDAMAGDAMAGDAMAGDAMAGDGMEGDAMAPKP
ncbi:hypothetical protein [Pelagibacterium sp.]|uniref:hypothetical protein n=1 Tax=Pelagibacterium sp. TaxID=1967288 RepID=UPI003A952C37